VELTELRRRPNGQLDDYIADEIALALGISGAAAGQRLHLALDLTERLPATLASLERGEIDLLRARVISDATGPLSAEHAAEVEPATAATTIYETVTACARQAATPGDERTADQRRADAFVDLILGTHIGPVAQVRVTVPATTLLGLDQAPGELAGYGPISAELAKEIAADATWRRLFTDPASGVLLDYGRTTYRPPTALADFVRARDKTCRFPGCRRAAEKCELDHRIEHPDGPTSADNLDALCPHHHQLKHHSDWSGHREPNGDYTWISPAGLRYTARAEPVGEPAAKESPSPPPPVCDPPPF
jgi:Domain of unknown function (DUF222)